MRLLFYFLILSAACLGQAEPGKVTREAQRTSIKRNTIFIEGLGNAGITGYSINYDHLFPLAGVGGISLRAGFSSKWDAFSCPALVNFVIGPRSSHLEIGAGWDLLRARNATRPGFYPVPTGNLTYRYQKPGGGFFFKIGYTPVFYDYKSNPNAGILIIFWFDCGASLGFTF